MIYFHLTLRCCSKEKQWNRINKRAIPYVSFMGFDQRGSYDKILAGGSTIVCLGDSVTYGYGLAKTESWPAQLQSKIQDRTNATLSVINRAVSGMDSNEALQREKHTIQKIAASKSRPIVLLMIGTWQSSQT